MEELNPVQRITAQALANLETVREDGWPEAESDMWRIIAWSLQRWGALQGSALGVIAGVAAVNGEGWFPRKYPCDGGF